MYPLKRKNLMKDTLQPGYIYDIETTQFISAKPGMFY